MKPAILATALAALTTLTADAALITWGAPQNITGDSDVSTNGTFVDAVMFSSDGIVANTTINGVTFTDVFFFFTSSSGVFSWSSIGSGGGYPGPLPPISNLSNAYQSMLRTSATDNFTLSLGGLTAGATYELQWWGSYSADFAGTTTALAGNSVTLDGNTTNANGGLGQFVVGTFVANGSPQQVQFTGNGGAAGVNGVQLRLLAPASVPEPGTALAGVMLAGLLGVRRRRGSQV